MVDTSTEAVNRLAKHIHSTCGCAIGSNAEQQVSGTLRALLAERDALRRENENLRQIERNVQDVREHEYKRAEAALAEVERLKAQPAQAVKVKPLVWVEGDEPDEWKSGQYDVWHEFGKYQIYYWSIVYGEPHPTSDAAKAAAQADYEAHIMAALDVQPVTVQDAARMPEVKALIGSAEKVLHDIGELVANSEGVAGLHMNGEVADWESLLPGGSFGAWLYSVDGLRAALRAITEGRK